MTVRDWWYKTAAVDVLKRMVELANSGDTEEPVCVKSLIQNKLIPVEECHRDGCSKCMETLLNETYEK